MEEDTPGQIHGITKITNAGKNTTQGPTDTVYEENDVKETHEYRTNKLDGRFYFAVGIMMVVILFFSSLHDVTESCLGWERDKTLAEQRKNLDEA